VGSREKGHFIQNKRAKRRPIAFYSFASFFGVFVFSLETSLIDTAVHFFLFIVPIVLIVVAFMPS
jgi:hypothetical protein